MVAQRASAAGVVGSREGCPWDALFGKLWGDSGGG